MRILGIDYGHKRIGLALSDESQTIARELTILSPKEFWESLPKFISENEITSIVLGYPLNMSGEPTQKTHEVETFEQKLHEATSLPIARMDERLSSSMAAGVSGSNKNIDSLAAQIILQNYLDRNKSSK